MRTLVVSDLHLGMRRHRDVLTRPAALDLLLQALEGIDRLVLLGDVVELSGRGREPAMAVAEPVLRRIGRRLGRGAEVILVPGNHDRALVRPWLRRVGARLTVDSRVPVDASPALAAIGSWLAPAPVAVRYPGVWLSERLWATHGHYLNRHLLPVGSVGITRGLLGRPPSDSARPVDYERGGGGPGGGGRAALGRFLPGPLGGAAGSLAGLIRAATMPRVTRTLLRPEFAPVNSSLLTVQMTRASLPALAHVAQRLGVDADWLLFGHVHRLGPLPGDDSSLWSGPGGRPRILNTGSWLYEPLLVHRAAPPHPYWPGGAVLLEDGRDPVVTGLLDGLSAAALR